MSKYQDNFENASLLESGKQEEQPSSFAKSNRKLIALLIAMSAVSFGFGHVSGAGATASLTGGYSALGDSDCELDWLSGFEPIGRGGLMSASGEGASRAFTIEENNNLTPNDCAKLCREDQTDNGKPGFMGFNLGYGRCECAYAKPGMQAYPVLLNTNGGLSSYVNVNGALVSPP